MRQQSEIRQERRFTDEQIEKANSISIIDYAKSRGYPVKQVTTHSFKIPGYGGLYIHSNGLKWNRFSADIGGGTIQFVMHMENKTWVEAIKELLNLPSSQYLYSTAVKEKFREKEPEKNSKNTSGKTLENSSVIDSGNDSENSSGNSSENDLIRDPVREPGKKPFLLPEKNDTYKHLFAYLICTRMINKQIVYDLVKLNKIYENKYYNSCVFVGYDLNGEAKYAAIRGTSSSMQYRKDVAGSDKSYPFAVNVRAGGICGESKFSSSNLYVFESPIDLMSYLSLLKLHRIKDFNACCISLGGVCDLALERFLNEHPKITEITLGLDNDEAGRFACEQIRQKYSCRYNIKRHIPENKDFNEDLIRLSMSGQEEIKNLAKEKTLQSKTPVESEMLLSQ